MKIKLILLALLIIPSVMALTIDPTSQSVELFTDKAENVFFNITNDRSEDIYYITLSSENEDIQFITNDFNLTKNQTKEIKLAIDTYTSYEEKSEIKIIYYLKSDVINDPTSETIDITSNKYEPNEIEVFSGSTITWTNTDTIKHSITSELFDEDLEPGESFPFTITNIGINNYYDKFTSLQGKIIVKDLIGQDYVHNPENDQAFNLNIKSKLVETEVKIDFLEKENFNISVNADEEAVLVIENIGGKTAEKVVLSSDFGWITFGLNEFYIAPGNKKYVPYTIMPIVTSSEETGKTHQITIFAKGENTFDANNSISVFVPYQEGVSLNDTAQQIFNQTFDEDFMISFHNIYCQALPESQYCKPEIVEKIVYQSQPLPYNHTQEDIHKTLIQQQEIRDEMSRSINTYHSEIETIKTDAQTASKNSAETKLIAEEIKKYIEETKKDDNTAFTVLMVLVILVFIGILGYFGIRKLFDWIRENQATRT